jgi:MFS family permease
LLAPLFESEVLLILCTSTMLVMLGQGIIGPILPLFAKSLGVSLAAVGLTLSAFAIARMFVNLPSGLVADRWGRRVLLVGGPFVTGVGSVLSGTANSIELLLLWRFLAGIGSAMYMTGAIIVVSDIATERNRGRLMAMNQGALLTGVTLGPAIGGIVAQYLGLRAPFYVVGVAAFAAGVWNLLRVPETRGTGPAHASAPAGLAEKRRGGIGQMVGLLLSLNFLLISLVTFAVFFARSGRQTVLPLLGHDEIGLSEGGIGLVFAMMAFLNLVLIVPAGALIDRFGVKATIVPSALVSGIGFGLFALSNSVPLYMVSALVLGVGGGILGPAPPAYAAEIAPPERRGAAMGLFRTLGDLGFVIAPPLVGYLADTAGFGLAVSINGAILVFSALVFAQFARRPKVVAEPATGVPASAGGN